MWIAGHIQKAIFNTYFLNFLLLERLPFTTHSSILAWRIPWTEEPGKQNRGTWQAAVRGVAKSQTRLSDWAHTIILSTSLCLETYSCLKK